MLSHCCGDRQAASAGLQQERQRGEGASSKGGGIDVAAELTHLHNKLSACEDMYQESSKRDTHKMLEANAVLAACVYVFCVRGSWLRWCVSY